MIIGQIGAGFILGLLIIGILAGIPWLIFLSGLLILGVIVA